MQFIVSLIPVVAVLLGLLSPLSTFLLWLRKEQRDISKCPLTRDLLRPPGFSLRLKIYKLGEEIMGWLVSTILIPLAVFAIHISQSYFASEPETFLRLGISLIAAFGFSIYGGWRLFGLLSELRNFILGLEGELATGEELNLLMLDGCRVFHDIPFPYGNIDHVVVSQSGVFAVNTKTCRKRKGGDANNAIVVDQQRGIIHFPDRDYRIPTPQFETERNWLAKFLSSAVAEQINVESILALPGWFVKERVGRGSVYVINPHKPKQFFVQNRFVLNAALVQRVAHQLEQLCRDVHASHGEQDERWEDG